MVVVGPCAAPSDCSDPGQRSASGQSTSAPAYAHELLMNDDDDEEACSNRVLNAAAFPSA
uniref:Uncharacterized protein n=1 Tax=Anopheles albimanus TaxID=7167 RepID=A0A182FY64_ANOAL